MTYLKGVNTMGVVKELIISGLVALAFVIVILVISAVSKPVNVAIDHKVMKESHQYKEGMEQQARILEVNIAEVEENMKNATDQEAKKMEGQLRILKLKLKALEVE